MSEYIEQPRAAQTAIQYASDVLAGRIVTGQLVKLACKRFLHDLETCKQRGFYFDQESAQHIVDFFGFLRHTKGIWAKRVETAGFKLEPWQVFILANLFGWKRTDNGQRRFRECYIEIARKNGKSTFIAGIGLYMLFADGEPGAEVYSAATTKEQAKIVFNAAKDMVKVSTLLNGRIGSWRSNLHVDETSSKFEPLASDSGTLDGLNIHCGLIDELHEHPDRSLYDVLNTALGSRSQPLIIEITTAGFNSEGICWDQRSYGVKILKGAVPDDDFVHAAESVPMFFAYIAALDEGDDPYDETVWMKANPNLGVATSYNAIRPTANKAKEQPTSQNEFFRKHLNVWTSSDTAWLGDGVWEKNSVGKVDMNTLPRDPQQQRIEALEKLKGRKCFGGLDMSSTDDVTGSVLVFPPCDRIVKVFKGAGTATHAALEAKPGQVWVKLRSTGEVKSLPMLSAQSLLNNGIAERVNTKVVANADLEQVIQEGDEFWHVLPFFFIPKGIMQERQKKARVPYDVWVKQGFVIATEGNTISHQTVRNTILELQKDYGIVAMGYDPWGCEWLAPELEKNAVAVVKVPQRIELLGPPSKDLTTHLIAGVMRHYDNPVLKWMASNVQMQTDVNGNYRPDKGKSRNKIDGVVAWVMAMGRAIAQPENRGQKDDDADTYKVRYI